MDANNQILPLAYGVGKIESRDSWTWFLNRLKGCFPHGRSYTFVSDRAAFIELALKEVFLDSHHVLCCRHLQLNLNLKSKKAKQVATMFWKCCKAYNYDDFSYRYARLSAASTRVHKYLEELDKSKWTIAYFSGNRFNVMTSNSAESMNSLSRHAHKLPIVMLIEFFRTCIQDWYYDRSAKAANVEHEVTPWAELKIEKRKKKSAKWTLRGITRDVYSVTDENENVNVVHTAQHTCECRRWQLSGIPCAHAIAAARFLKLTDCSHWVIDWYRTYTYRATYNDSINPVPNRNYSFRPSDFASSVNE